MNSFTLQRFQTFLAAGLLATASASALAAPSPQDPPLVKAELVSSVEAVHPGEQITVGLHQRIAPHWHTYWINPGDSGLATTLEWQLPAGAKAGDIQWPAPHRFTQGPVTNYGYEDEVTLLSSIQVPADAKPGTTLPIQTKAKWLVCREVCIPQEAQLTLSLPVVPAGAARGEGNALIKQAQAQLPIQGSWTAQAVLQAGGGLALRIPKVSANWKAASEVWFYSDEWGRIAHNAPQPRKDGDEGSALQLTAGDAPAAAGQVLKGVLVVTEGEGNQAIRKSYALSTTVRPGAAGTLAGPSAAPLAQAPATSSAPPADLTLGSALVLALLGGLVLNLMPCVFPVLSIKALALLNHREQTPRQARLHGLVYTAGVLSSFALLGGLLIALKAGGGQVGWGFQFQSPVFVLAVAYLMFAVGLSLSGVFTIGGSVTGVGSSLASREGYAGSFFTGVLATVVATPCTAPFMGGAIGFALGQPAAVLLAVFLSLGLGLALPYLLLSWWPRLQRWLPRPGLWMERVKQVFAFPMYGAAVWLVWVLAQQAGVDAVAVALGGILAIAFAAWVYDSSRASQGAFRHAGTLAAVVFLAIALGGGYVGIQSGASGGLPEARTAGAGAEKAGWEPYSASRLSDLRTKGQPVFVNLTAAWCITCLVNERVALSRPAVVRAFKASGITYLKGDWTNQDPEISRVLSEFGRSGVPLYLLYPEGLQSKPVVLPQILTPEVVLAAVKDAAAAPLVSSR